jgi:cytochrome c oxidase subunit 2
MNEARSKQTETYTTLFLGALFWFAGSLFVATRGLGWFMPEAASAEAESVDTLFQVMLFFATFIFLMVETLIIYMVVRFAFGHDRGEGEPIHGNAQLEILWTFIPAVLVFGITIYSYIVLVETTEAKDDTLQIDVTAQRFFWNFQYPDEDMELSSNHILVIPDDQVVELKMTSTDVIHAFWVAEFRVKNDVMPGRTTTLRFTPTERTGLPADVELLTLEDLNPPGPDTACPVEDPAAAPAAEEEVVEAAIEGDSGVSQGPPVMYENGYDLICAELCGANHGLMRGEVFVVSRQEYEAYLESLRAQIIAQQAQQEYALRCGGEQIKVAGRQIFYQYACQTCHMLNDADSLAMGAGPALNGVGGRAATRADYDSAEDYILTSIINPNAYIVDGYAAGVMPQNFADQIPPDQLQLLVAYLALQTE